ncbi:hypothetical protein IG631_09472 [Alternaria alternata]|nr:hypothetical protein IG631_09472 [Alternaria alternata]
MGNILSVTAIAAFQAITNHVLVSATTLWYFVHLDSGRCGSLGALMGLDINPAVNQIQYRCVAITGALQLPTCSGTVTPRGGGHTRSISACVAAFESIISGGVGNLNTANQDRLNTDRRTELLPSSDDSSP